MCKINPEELKRQVGICAFIWAPFPYTQSSIARLYAKTQRDLDGAESIVRACMRIIECHRPDRWAMENLCTGKLKRRDVVALWSFYLKRISYCIIGFPYKKETVIWTNAQVNLPACSRPTPCDTSRASGRRNHPGHAQNGFSGSRSIPGQDTTNNLHRISAGLVALLCTSSSL